MTPRPLWLRARCFVHATEDEGRVRDALLWCVGLEGRPRANDRVTRTRAKGHWGNDILVLEVAVKGEEDIQDAMRALLAEPGLRSSLVASLERRLDDDGVLHVRLDKQAAVGRRLAEAPGGDAFVVTTKAHAQPGVAPLEVWRRGLALT